MLEIYGRESVPSGICNEGNSAMGYVSSNLNYATYVAFVCGQNGGTIFKDEAWNDNVKTYTGNEEPSNATYHVYSIYFPSSSSESFSYDYGSVDTGSGSALQEPIGVGNWQSNGADFFMTWVRLRTYPPDGVMPNVSFSS